MIRRLIILLLIVGCEDSSSNGSSSNGDSGFCIIFCGDEPLLEPEDCAGVAGGTAVEDNCGVCDIDLTNDCVQDGCGVWGGDNSSCDGNSYIVFAEDGMSDMYAAAGISYTITADIEGYDWDGVYDVNLLTTEFDCVSDLPNQSITPGTYDYTVTVNTTTTDDGVEATSSATYCTSDSFCPYGGVVAYNAPLVVAPNLVGGVDMYYIFYVSYAGLVTQIAGVADCSSRH